MNRNYQRRNRLYEIALVAAAALSGCDEAKNQPMLREDVNGDGRPDIVYAIDKSGMSGPKYATYVKYNKGEGKFSDPVLLLDDLKAPPEGMLVVK